jgi:serine/threonine-protein kinase
MLSPERWQIVERVFHAALEYPPADRQWFIDSSCGGDEEVRREVEGLLAADSSSDVPNAAAAPARAAAEWAAAPRPTIVGRDIGGYRVVSLLGAGGMGEVYLADDLALGRRVALKLLPTQFTEDPGRLRRFSEEARAASALNHPNIITVHHIGAFEHCRYIVTEFIAGETLRARLARGPLTEPEALDVATQIASALQAAHAAGIIHRDIKPENVMIRPDGYVKVLDFGLAKLAPDEHVGGTAGLSQSGIGRTRAGAVLGTPNYMAPEQALGAAVDARADIFSLSIVLHEMITGALPFGSSGENSQTSSPPTAALSPAVSRVLRRGLAIDPAARYQAIDDLLRDLDAQPHVPAGTEWRMSRRLWAAALTAALLVVTGAGLAWSGFFRRGPPPISSVAVLPFDVLGAAEDASHLRAAMADAITNRLAGRGSIRVPPAATINHFARQNADPFAMGRELQVEGLLTGTIQRAGDRIRVTAQLLRVSDGGQAWAGTFNERFTDIFSLQDAIAAELAPSLMAGVGGGAGGPTAAARLTHNVEAYDLYTRGLQSWTRFTPQAIQAAISYFERATAEDPQFARAWSAMANAYAVTASGLPPWERFPKAKAAVTKALELDDRIAEAHTSLAFISYKWEWQWATAEREFRRAIELEPDYMLAHHWFGEYLSVVGRHDDALAELARARTLDPHSINIRLDTGLALARAGRGVESEAVFRDALVQDPGSAALYNGLSNTLRVLGKYDEAFEALVRARTIAGFQEPEIRALRERFVKGGFDAITRADIEDLLRVNKTGARSRLANPGSVAGTLARFYATIGERDSALAWLEEATRRHDDGPLAIRTMWYWNPFRKEPRFQAVEKTLAMP